MPRLEVAADGFRFDDRPLRIISGGLHYFRIHPEQWADRLRKARLMGLNTIETYVPWNVHSPRPGGFRLDAGLDLPRLLDLAAAEDLHVPLRPGPYICAEWEGGGLPSWLLADEDIEPRSRDPRCLKAVDDCLAALLPPVLPYLSTRGGPILAVQLENEYGAYGDDSGYLEELAELLRRQGADVPHTATPTAGQQQRPHSHGRAGTRLAHAPPQPRPATTNPCPPAPRQVIHRAMTDAHREQSGVLGNGRTGRVKLPDAFGSDGRIPNSSTSARAARRCSTWRPDGPGQWADCRARWLRSRRPGPTCPTTRPIRFPPFGADLGL